MTRPALTRPRRLFLELALVCLPPLAWFANLELGYAMVPWSCHTGRTTPLHVATLAMALVVAASGIVAWRARPKAPASDRLSVQGRSAFLTVLGIAGSALFVLVILTNEFARLVLDPCISSAG